MVGSVEDENSTVRLTGYGAIRTIMDSEILVGGDVSVANSVIVVARAVPVDGFARQGGGWRLPAMHSPVGDLHDLVLPLRITEAYL